MNKNTTSNPSNQELGYSPDALGQRRTELLALLSQTAPEVLSDLQQINVDKLKALLGDEHIAGDEHYELSWAGKTAARREIQKTSSHTLRPDANNPGQAQHMLIEGENLEVLRVLQKSYYGKVKMIYIDPPYNTGNDSFVYPDDYSETLEQYQKRTGEKNEAGYLNKQSLWKKNSKESGQYHSAWLSMMYPRLYLARNLLRDDGVIFISIDDNEAANLKLLCDEIFGENNSLPVFTRVTKKSSNNGTTFSPSTDYILGYAKNISCINPFAVPLTEDQIKSYNKIDSRGAYKEIGLFQAALKHGGSRYPIEAPDGSRVITPRGLPWRWSEAKFQEGLAQDLIVFKKSTQSPLIDVDTGETGTWNIYTKLYLADREGVGLLPKNYSEEFQNNLGSNDLRVLNIPFDFPKPVSLIKFLALIIKDEEALILDFFSGSGTTAQAVIALNAEDGGSRKFIGVQLAEKLDEDNEAYKAGYRSISEITRSRISKVIDQLRSERPIEAADLACAYFTLAPSNFKVWQADVSSSEALREQLSIFQSAEKGGQSKQADAQTAMLTELLLKHGLGALGVHAIVKPRQVAGVTIHRVLMADDKTMWLCFETYTEALKDEIVKAMPAQIVMLNSCFVGGKADEQLANLQLELAGLDIGLTVI